MIHRPCRPSYKEELQMSQTARKIVLTAKAALENTTHVFS